MSIVVCTYNGELFIREQIDSLLLQTYPVYEVIIQDDCSTDGTWSILEEYHNRYPSIIKLFRNATNLFWNQNFYSAIRKATGDYIALCDQDDIWARDKIEKQVLSLQSSNKQISICSHYYWNYDENTLSPVIIRKQSLLQSFFYPQFSGHLFLLKSSVVSLLDQGIKVDMAHDIFLGIIGAYFDSIEYSNEQLVHWRRHKSTATSELSTSPISGFRKCLYTIHRFIKGSKSSVISAATNKYLQVYKWLGEKAVRGNLEEEIHFMELLHNQTVWSYIKASFSLPNGATEYVHLPKNPFLKFYSRSTFLFRWWYDHQYSL